MRLKNLNKGIAYFVLRTIYLLSVGISISISLYVLGYTLIGQEFLGVKVFTAHFAITLILAIVAVAADAKLNEMVSKDRKEEVQ